MATRTLEIVISASDKASGVLGKVGGSLGSLGKFAAVGAAGVVAGGVAIGGAMLKMAADAAPLEGIQSAFEGVAASFEGGSDAMLAALKEGSAGMITNRDLMLNFNKAAQLVSKDFAEQLPDAMKYLGKVSAATGQDMSYLLDSITVGVGRLSPMILDNLAIQVDMVAANEAWAKSAGKSVDEMTKQEKQAALMAQVIEKLRDNTADMPDITDNASTKMAQMTAKIKDAKDQIGLALLPVLQKLMGAFSDLVSKYLPKVISFFTGKLLPAFSKIGPVIGNVAKWLESFIGYISIVLTDGDHLNDWLANFPASVQPFITAISWVIEIVKGLIENILHLIQWGELLHPSEFMPGFSELPGWLQGIITQVWDIFSSLIVFISDTLIPGIGQVVDFVQQNLEPILAGVAAVILTVIVPAFAAWAIGAVTAAAATIAALAPILIPLAAIGIAAALLYKAWQTNFHGIRDTITEIWEGSIKPALTQIASWLSENIPKAIEILKQFFESVLKPAINEVVTFASEMFGKLVSWVQQNWPLIQEAISDTMGTIKTIIETILNAIQTFWNAHGAAILSAASDIWDAIKWAIESALNLILGIIKAILLVISGDWEAAWEMIKQALVTTWNTITTWVRDYALPWLADLIKTGMDKLVEIVLGIGQAMYDAGVAIINNLWNGLKAKIAEVQDWFRRKLQEIGDMIPFSEPKDRTSPLYGLSRAGEAIIENILEGMRKAFPEFKTRLEGIIAEIKGLFDIGAAFGSFAAAIFEKRNLEPLEKNISAIEDRIKRIDAEIEHTKDLSAREGLTPYQQAFYAQQLIDLDNIRLGVTEDLAKAQADYTKEQEKLVALQEAQEKLAFLKNQFALLETLQRYGLNAGEILGDLKLGADASADAIIEAMTRAITAINERLGSSIFPNLGLPGIPIEGPQSPAGNNIVIYGGLSIQRVGNLDDLIQQLQELAV